MTQQFENAALVQIRALRYLEIHRGVNLDRLTRVVRVEGPDGVCDERVVVMIEQPGGRSASQWYLVEVAYAESWDAPVVSLVADNVPAGEREYDTQE